MCPFCTTWLTILVTKLHPTLSKYFKHCNCNSWWNRDLLCCLCMIDEVILNCVIYHTAINSDGWSMRYTTAPTTSPTTLPAPLAMTLIAPSVPLYVGPARCCFADHLPKPHSTMTPCCHTTSTQLVMCYNICLCLDHLCTEANETLTSAVNRIWSFIPLLLMTLICHLS